MSAGQRQNTKTYLEKMIGNGYQFRSRSYNVNGVIKQTSIFGRGDAYSCGEKLNQLAAKGQLRTDIGVLKDYTVSSETGQYDAITLQFEELLNKNRYGFSIFTNVRLGEKSLPLQANDYTNPGGTGTNFEQTKNAYKWAWDHGIYTKADDPSTVTTAEYTAWAAAGWDSTTQAFDDIGTGLNSTDLESKAIKIVKTGTSIPAGYTLAKYADGDKAGKAVTPQIPGTTQYAFPKITIVQTVYCESDDVIGNILATTSTLFAPRKSSLSPSGSRIFDTYGIDSTNKAWLCKVQSIDTQSAISKVVVSFEYKKNYWNTDLYPEIKSDKDPWINGF